jgi:hypothetical protein
MKHFSSLALFMVVLLVALPQAKAQIPPKPKAFLTIVGYGAAGGAILGAASTAFGTTARAIPQGASLGLYAGILFGTYVLVSHHNRQYGTYDDNSSPYKESSDIYGDDYQSDEGGGEREGSQSGFFDRFQSVRGGNKFPPIYVDLIQYHF